MILFSSRPKDQGPGSLKNVQAHHGLLMDCHEPMARLPEVAHRTISPGTPAVASCLDPTHKCTLVNLSLCMQECRKPVEQPHVRMHMPTLEDQVAGTRVRAGYLSFRFLVLPRSSPLP
uniref:Uncharacterized protein n=1 Tax=Micrurus lemniscatus lemniscatus TaxID=129467 RepID=A0A2D4H8F1_MICLE